MTGVGNDVLARVEEANDVAQCVADCRAEASNCRSQRPITDGGMTRNTNMGALRVIWTGNVVIMGQLCGNSSNSGRHGIRRKHSIVWHGVDDGGDTVVASDGGSGRGVRVSVAHGAVDGNDDGGPTLIDSEGEGVDGDEVVSSAAGSRSKTDATRSGLATSLDKWVVMAT